MGRTIDKTFESFLDLYHPMLLGCNGEVVKRGNQAVNLPLYRNLVLK